MTARPPVGRPAPGHPTTAHSAPGHPTTAHPTPGHPTTAPASPGHRTPGHPVAGRAPSGLAPSLPAPAGPSRGPGAGSLTGGEAVVRALATHGVTDAFGIPGTHNLEIYRHLPAYGIRHVTPRHEQGAGYAADAYARVSGRPGVAITTTGPALLNIAAAVGQAYSDSVPLLVVSPGMPLRHPRQSTGLLHEMRSQTEALRGVAAFSHRVASVDEIGAAVARAFTLFRTGRPRPVHIEVPLDLLESAEPAGPVRPAPPTGPAAPDPACVRAAADALLGARRPALVLGGGARTAAAECRALAGALGAPVVTTANGKGVVDERHPLSLGVSLHSPAVQKWLADRDVVLAVGTELAESDVWGPLPSLEGTLIRVDLDPAQMYAQPPADLPLVGDARLTLAALLTACRGRARDTAEADDEADLGALVTDLRTTRDDETRTRDARWLPYLRAMRRVLAEDAVITSDSAQCCYYGALPHLPVGPEGRYLHPTGFGTLGYALPAAIGATTACPGRQVVALSGDGGLQFSVQELATAAGSGLPLPVVVFDNGGYGEIREEMAARGDAFTGVDLPAVDLPGLARAYGGRGVVVRSPAELAAALAEALVTPGPTIVTVPEESPR
ncbi:5-guanidino-2-oxopentanoate decarboxylase [Streptomyces sp. NPDC056632]|uniref:5-guanidino-2-oxopentanoate decarboxylase n=1 Tax=unclassified Streptomyces TaxID=2593676 RepID=UPI0036CD4BD3